MMHMYIMYMNTYDTGGYPMFQDIIPKLMQNVSVYSQEIYVHPQENLIVLYTLSCTAVYMYI